MIQTPFSSVSRAARVHAGHVCSCHNTRSRARLRHMRNVSSHRDVRIFRHGGTQCRTFLSHKIPSLARISLGKFLERDLVVYWYREMLINNIEQRSHIIIGSVAVSVLKHSVASVATLCRKFHDETLRRKEER